MITSGTFWKKFIKYSLFGLSLAFALLTFIPLSLQPDLAVLAEVASPVDQPILAPSEPGPDPLPANEPVPAPEPAPVDVQPAPEPAPDQAPPEAPAPAPAEAPLEAPPEVPVSGGDDACKQRPELCPPPAAAPAPAPAPAAPAPAPAPVAPAPAAPQTSFICPRVDVVRVEEDCFQGSVCKFNVWQGPGENGECINGRGGAFGCQAVPGRCGLPAQPAPPAPQPPAPVQPVPIPPAQRVLPECNTLGTQFICGQLTFDRCSFNADGSVSDCVSSRNPNCHSGPIRCDRPQQPAPAPAAPAPARPAAPNINQQCPAGTNMVVRDSVIVCQSQQQTQTNNQTQTVTAQGGQGGSSRVTVTQEAAALPPAAARAVLARAQVVEVAGVSTVKELPKTGIPDLAWAAAAFIPLGFGLRGFGTSMRRKINSYHYLGEQRKYKLS